MEIGKFTLESLTTGMYEQPLIIYREYLQNAADSLEDAVRNHLLSDREMRVDVKINTIDRSIEIFDNGSGIVSDMAETVLMSIGTSQKVHTESRGFRGIGRLGGISYCEQLEFETTAFGESIGTRVSFDCSRLRELMLPGENTSMSMEEVLLSSSSAEHFDVDEEEHYFIVRMVGVDERTGLLDSELVTPYLSQTAPVTYHPYFKMLADCIYGFLSENGVALTEFPVSLSYDGKHPKPLNKAFSRHYVAGRGKDSDDDTIYEIETFKVTGAGQELLALGWYAKSSWLGMLKDETIRGMRLRKGNIQIGDEHTLDIIFKEARFNGWTQGEVFVVDDKLIPNARRDNFEQNNAYWELINALKAGIGSSITSQIREASKQRNDPAQKAVKAGQTFVKNVQAKQQAGFNSGEEFTATRESVENMVARLSKAKVTRPELHQQQQETVQQLQTMLKTFDEDASFKTDKLKGVLSKKEKRVLQVASDVMTKYLDEVLLDTIVNDIVEELSK